MQLSIKFDFFVQVIVVDFNNYISSGTAEITATFVVKHTLTVDNSRTGKYFSNDVKTRTEITSCKIKLILDTTNFILETLKF